MAEVKNAFIKSKMNKDLDDRLIPSGEYRDAVNVQVSRSESSDVGALENVLGNAQLEDFSVLTDVDELSCVGFFADNAKSIIYLFFTDYDEQFITNPGYDPASNNFIFSYNTLSNTSTLLVEGSFLNFSKTNPIHGVNLLEDLLFWTDNRNQPRKINITLANSTGLVNPIYYTTEDQISVAKYNPYQPIQMYATSINSGAAIDDYESTMKDVVSMYYPNGGVGNVVSATSNTAVINSFIGDLVLPSDNYDSGASISYVDSTGNIVNITGATLSSATYNEPTSSWSIGITNGTFPALTTGQKIVFNANPYYDNKFAGDINYLEDKFVRFGYRYRFDDGEYSLFSTFTQAAFIPKQDGYFMYVKKDDINEVSDESSAFRSTIVSFVENKVNDIKLRIPLPFNNYSIRQDLKVTAIDIIYKESDGVAVKVIDTLLIDEISMSSGICITNASSAASNSLSVDNLQGGVIAGQTIKGDGIVGNPTVVSFEYTAGSTTSGVVTMSNVQTIADNIDIIIGEPGFFVYNYQSKKPFKTLPSSELIRVYDKVPVKALAQEVISNRVVYGNYQDKHTPPNHIDYNVLISEKSDFNTRTGSAEVSVVDTSNSVTIINLQGNVAVGSKVVSSFVPNETVVVSILGSLITFNNNVTLSVSDIVKFKPSSNIENTTSSVSYPSSSLKTNRTYQVGVVLADRYGRQSTTILSNNTDSFSVNGVSYSGSTLFSPYINENVNPIEWIGNSIKLLFNNQIGNNKNYITGEPGVYNGEKSSVNYNPLGWYSFKVVVKQTEQEYYNVYLPGIMASYPEDSTLEIGNTSHTVLINDNINKIPRDLSQVGPDQKLYRSSVQLFGRVQNSSETTIETNIGEGNAQYFPGSKSDTVNTVAAVNNLFDYNKDGLPEPNRFPQFYSLESNPLVARISTNSKIGQFATFNYSTSSSVASIEGTTDLLRLVNVVGDASSIQVGDIVSGPGFPSGLKVDSGGFTAGSTGPTTYVTAATTSNTIEIFNGTNVVAGQSVVGVGIPEGSYVLEKLESPWRIIINNIASVSNNATVDFTNAATLDVTSSVSISSGDVVNVSSASTPGIQQLAVYETEPVESLLDIFWETSTTGLVADLNNVVLTSGDGSGAGAKGLNSFNTSPFTEALWPSATFPPVYPAIFTAPIYLVDPFEQQIPSGEINSPLAITEVLNGNGTNVQLINSTGPYFNLVETSTGSYEYNILIAEAFTQDVYYSASPSLNTFTFYFTATVNNQVTTFSETISLENEPPFIQKPLELGPPYTEPIVLENVQTSEQNIIDLGGSNGSGGTTFNVLIFPPNLGADLTWEKETEVNSSGVETDYFVVDSLTGNVTNTGYQDLNMPADVYTLDIKLSDPSLSVNRDLVIGMGLEVSQLQERVITGTLGTSLGGAAFTATFFFILVAPRPDMVFDPLAGWYGYTTGNQSVAGPWATLITNTGGNVIDIDTTNSGSACFPWKYLGYTSLGDAQTAIYTSQCVPTLFNQGTWTAGSILNPDPINYTFQYIV